MKMWLFPRLDCIGNLLVWSEKDLANSFVSMMRATRAPVQGLLASGVGMKSSDSEIERGLSMVLVGWIFFCFPQRCPLLVASDFVIRF